MTALFGQTVINQLTVWLAYPDREHISRFHAQ